MNNPEVIALRIQQGVERYNEIKNWEEYEDEQALAKARLEAREREQLALEEARAADEDEEFMQGYKEFLDTEFTIS